MKLRNRLLIIFLVISIIPVTGFTFFIYQKYDSVLDEQIRKISDNMVEAAVDEANQSLKDIGLIQEAVSYDAVSQNSLIEQLYQYTGETAYTSRDIYETNQIMQSLCQNLFRFYSYLNGIYIFTPSGEVLGYSVGTEVAYDYLPFEDVWYQETLRLNGKTYVEGGTEKEFLLNAGPSVSFSSLITDPFSQKALGVLYIDCSMEMFDLSRVNTIPEQACVQIMNGSRQLYTNGLAAEQTDSSEDLEEYQCPLSVEGVSLAAVVNHTGLKKEQGQILAALLLFWLGCMGLCTGLSVFLSRNITEPIRLLSERMSSHSIEKEAAESVYSRRKDEIGILYKEYEAMIHQLDHYIKNELQNKLMTLNAQMRSLEAQINAHFLYNTLEAISSLAAIEEVPEISVMAEALSDMFRYSIKTQSELVFLEDELTHVQNYVSIQQIRFDQGFRMIWDVPEDLKQIRILKLILQPFVENALYHGLLSCSCGSSIRLEARREAELMYIRISDDGAGMDQQTLEKLRQSIKESVDFTELGFQNGQSIGIKNINARIQLYYGQRYGVRIESELGKGSTFTLVLPAFSELPEKNEVNTCIHTL